MGRNYSVASFTHTDFQHWELPSCRSDTSLPDNLLHISCDVVTGCHSLCEALKMMIIAIITFPKHILWDQFSIELSIILNVTPQGTWDYHFDLSG